MRAGLLPIIPNEFYVELRTSSSHLGGEIFRRINRPLLIIGDIPSACLSVDDTSASMETERVVPTEQELKGFDLNDPSVVELIHHAQEGDEADRLLTVRQALKKYKKAVFWALFLSTSLIMEGYDLVIVRTAQRLSPSSFEAIHNPDADTPATDQFILWPVAVSNPIRGIRPASRPQCYRAFVAVWPV